MFGRATRWMVLLLLPAMMLVGAGCSRSPEVRKARHLERADRYFDQAQYSDAVIEYQRALRIDSKDARAVTRLGLALYQSSGPVRAFPYLVKSLELDPANSEVR